MRRLCKFLVLLALVLMPFGMVSAPAVAASASAAQAVMPCPDMHDEAPAQHHEGNASGLAHCTMVCTAALPAPAAAFGNTLRPHAPRETASVHDLAGLEPEIATPPPRIA